MAVAVFHRMKAGRHADMGDVAQRFARALHDQWGVGNPDCQNGALLLLAVGDRQVSSQGAASAQRPDLTAARALTGCCKHWSAYIEKVAQSCMS